MDRCIITATLVIGVLFQVPAFGYPTPVDFDGEVLRWDIRKEDNASIRYYIQAEVNSDLNFYDSVVEQAADLWTEVESSYFVFERTFDSGLAEVTVNLDRNQGSNSASSGYASFSFDTDGKPKHCEIHVATSTAEVEKTILHELGHCVGLGHSLISESIMSYDADKNGFWLDVDDIAAISRLYPIDGSSPKLPPGCAINDGKISASAILLVVLLAPLIVVAFRPYLRYTARG